MTAEYPPKTPKIKCLIEFENNATKVFYTGQTICGKISLCLSELKSVRRVFVKIVGQAKVAVIDENDTKSISGNEIFFDEKVYLVDDERSAIEESDTSKYLRGTHQYIFTYTLPQHLPTTLEVKYGWIRYKVCVVLDKPFWANQEFEESFTVIRVSKLNASVLEPVTLTNEKIFYPLWCCSSGTLKTVARISSGGFIPRQTINLNLNVVNESNQQVSEITLQLIQEIKYSDHSGSRTEKILLKIVYARGCDPYQVEDIDVNILVPTVPPTQNTVCTIIKVKYYIRIFVSLPFGHYDPELILPITIGSNPIEDNPALPTWINQLYLVDSLHCRKHRSLY